MFRPASRVLEPDERIAEVLFGLIMVLTFTGSLSVAEAGRAEIRAMLIAALGCNLAWGIIDGVLYLMGALAERGSALRTYRALRSADPGEGQQVLASALPPLVSGVLSGRELEQIRRRLIALPEPPATARLQASEWQGALGVFLLVFLSTLPVAIPFMVMAQPPAALRVSNAVAVAMLFVAGLAYGRVVGRSPWGFGFGMVALGSALVTLTMALGG